MWLPFQCKAHIYLLLNVFQSIALCDLKGQVCSQCPKCVYVLPSVFRVALWDFRLHYGQSLTYRQHLDSHLTLNYDVATNNQYQSMSLSLRWISGSAIAHVHYVLIHDVPSSAATIAEQPIFPWEWCKWTLDLFHCKYKGAKHHVHYLQMTDVILQLIHTHLCIWSLWGRHFEY